MTIEHAAFPQPKATLAQFGLFPKKSFGQNFLADSNLVERIADLAGASRAQVVEIGAGLGGLTAALLQKDHEVIAIERDRDLIPVLNTLFAGAIERGQLRVLEADAKQLRVEELFREGSPRVVMGNLPYQITGPLLQNAVHSSERFERAVFLVQREVADRLAAAPGSKTYGALSVFCQAAFKVERAFLVRRGAFYPQPNVDSAVVTLTPHPVPLARETASFVALVRAAFHERRKVLRNAWDGVLGVPKAELPALAEVAGVSLEARGETLDVAAFERMAQGLQGLVASRAGKK
jgi:16S rRNA (adenine1518-N6/adenine1519-N6)-dimethyltransferase